MQQVDLPTVGRYGPWYGRHCCLWALCSQGLYVGTQVGKIFQSARRHLRPRKIPPLWRRVHFSKKRKRDAALAKGGGGLMERYASQPFEEDVEDNNGNLEQSSSQNIAADFFQNLQQDGGAPRGASACLPAEC